MTTTKPERYVYTCAHCGKVLAVTQGREQTIRHRGRIIVCRLIATTCDRCGAENVFGEEEKGERNSGAA